MEELPTDIYRVIRNHLPYKDAQQLALIRKGLKAPNEEELKHIYSESKLLDLIKFGSLQGVKYLVEKRGVHPKPRVVDIAVEYNRLSILIYLLNWFQLNWLYYDYNEIRLHALNMAALRGRFEIIRLLVENGTPLYGLTPYYGIGQTTDVLESAIKRGILKIVKYLVENGGHIGNLSPLYAVMHSNIAVLDYILDLRPGVTHEALNEAIMYKNLLVVKHLLERDPDLAVWINPVNAKQIWQPQLLEYLLEDVDIHREEEKLLQLAITMGHFELVKYLVERGANIHILNDEPIRLAKENGYIEILKYLRSVPAL